MDAETWDSQPYWAQRIYAEGLLTEKPWEIQMDESGQPYSPLNTAWDSFGDLDIEDNSNVSTLKQEQHEIDKPIEVVDEIPVPTNNFISPEMFGNVRYVNKFGE
jgi:hypothetical protein